MSLNKASEGGKRRFLLLYFSFLLIHYFLDDLFDIHTLLLLQVFPNAVVRGRQFLDIAGIFNGSVVGRHRAERSFAGIFYIDGLVAERMAAAHGKQYAEENGRQLLTCFASEFLESTLAIF